ncbi:LysR substrate-binding domain-containing protein [Acidocella sp.]|uniref:LysR substrate-binding domain-containing protein n=1 Tax=Acidocella sp. TaxID=50710 RepID=UPI002634CD25|nr:LysR substrate-binding domain-containing protein [Acidocella sp.]
MDLRHMRHFVAVAEELHFGKAALRLNIAQPPLSQSIQRLEKDLGVELFDRSRRSVELTAAGRVFLVEARRTLMHADLARKMAQREAARLPETRVSFVGPALYRVLPELIVRYRAAAPQVAVRLLEASSLEQVAGLLSGDFDVAFIVGGTAIGNECESMIVERAALLAAVPANWKLAARKSITMADLAEQPYIRPPAKLSPNPDEMLSMFKRVGVMPEVVQEAKQTNTTLGLVGAGIGCSLVMATAALAKPGNIKFLPIEDLPSHRPWELLMVWHPELIGRITADFIAVARAYVQENWRLLGLAEDAG